MARRSASSSSARLAVELEDVEVRYGRQVAVDRVSVDIVEGDFHVLLGRSGSGKTTLLRAIAGFEPITHGRIALSGREVERGDRRARVAPEDRRIGFVFQDYALFPHLSVERNVSFGMATRSREAVAASLSRVGLEGFERRRPGELSGGEQQRVAVARALAQQPSVVLFDEPFSNLDRALRRHVREETVTLLRDTGVTAIFVTHDAEEAFALADTVSVLHQGRLVQTGSPSDIYRRPVDATVARLGGEANLVEASATSDSRHVDSVLGRLELHGEAPAGTRVVVRPEQLEVTAGDGDDGVPATVHRRRFLGAVDELELVLSNGSTVLARVTPTTAPPGDTVRVRVVGTVARIAA